MHVSNTRSQMDWMLFIGQSYSTNEKKVDAEVSRDFFFTFLGLLYFVIDPGVVGCHGGRGGGTAWDSILRRRSALFALLRHTAMLVQPDGEASIQ